MSNMAPKKHLLSLFLTLTKPFTGCFNSSGNSIYVIAMNVLQAKIFIYTPSIDSII